VVHQKEFARSNNKMLAHKTIVYSVESCWHCSHPTIHPKQRQDLLGRLVVPLKLERQFLDLGAGSLDLGAGSLAVGWLKGPALLPDLMPSPFLTLCLLFFLLLFSIFISTVHCVLLGSSIGRFGLRDLAFPPGYDLAVCVQSSSTTRTKIVLLK
jgi:hypothetical protein